MGVSDKQELEIFVTFRGEGMCNSTEGCPCYLILSS